MVPGIATALAFAASPLAATKPSAASHDAVQAVGQARQSVGAASSGHLAISQSTGFSRTPATSAVGHGAQPAPSHAASQTGFDRTPAFKSAIQLSAQQPPRSQAARGNEGGAHQGAPTPAAAAHPANRFAASVKSALG